MTLFRVVLELADEQEKQLPRVTRRNLAKKLGCHYNTLRNDELLIKEWVDDVDYPSTKGLAGVPLTPYLTWLLIKVRSLRNKYPTDTLLSAYLFQNPQKFSQEAFEEYVGAIAHKRKKIDWEAA